MKKTALMLSSILLVTASCMKGGTGIKINYVLEDTVEYSNEDELFKDGATYFLFADPEIPGEESGFLSSNVNLYFSKMSYGMLEGGFCLSKQSWEKPSSDNTDTETSEPGEYSVYGQNGTNGSANTFFYFRQTLDMPEHDMAFASASIGTYTPIRVSVCNSAATVRAIRGTDVNAATFNLAGDYSLTVTGYLNGQKTGTATLLLAGKGKSKLPATEENPQRDSIITSWSTMDLSGLGNIDYIDFDLSFSDTQDEGLFRYTDVCIDKLTATVNINTMD